MNDTKDRKEEVLKLTAVLAEVRAAMVADGRITLKPKYDAASE